MEMQLDERAMAETIDRRFGGRDKVEVSRLITPLNIWSNTKSAGYLYVVRSKQWAPNVYKYGKSSIDERRFSGYNNHNPNDVDIHAIYMCIDVNDAESHLHTILNVYRHDRNPNAKREFVVIHLEYLLRLIEATLEKDAELSQETGVFIYSTYRHNCDEACKQLCSPKVLDNLLRAECNCKLPKKPTLKKQLLDALFRKNPTGVSTGPVVSTQSTESTGVADVTMNLSVVHLTNSAVSPASAASSANQNSKPASWSVEVDRVFARKGTYQVVSELPFLNFLTGYNTAGASRESIASASLSVADASMDEAVASASLQTQFEAANLLVQQKKMLMQQKANAEINSQTVEKDDENEEVFYDDDEMDTNLKPNQRPSGWFKRKRENATGMIERQSKQKVGTL